MTGKPTFFATPADWRAWLETHHATAEELSVGFWKKDSGKPSMSWPESVDEALAFGWIDGVRHRIDDEAYRIRFTPRRPGGNWSQVNIKRFGELKTAGRIAPSGQAAFDAAKTNAATYSYEKAAAEFTAEELAAFKANKAAWAFFESLPAGFRKTTVHRVTSAKRADTRAKRLKLLIDASAAGRRVDPTNPGAGFL